MTIVYKSLPLYRIPFFEALRSDLAARGVALRLIYGQADAEDAKKRDTGAIAWGQQIQNRPIPFGARRLLWQPCTALIRGSDLVIVEQASRLLLNYVLLTQQALGGPKVAFWGHGRDFNKLAASRAGEAVKRLVSRWPHWWFAYTEGTADVVRGLPYPAERITVVQNTVDVAGLQAHRAATDSAQLVALRCRLGIEGRNVAVYTGGLYAEKRVAFLIDAARILRRRIADFELIVIGAGPDQALVEEAAHSHRWIHYVGPVFGNEKVPYFGLSRVMLLPGLVGLGVVDAFALEVPLVTVDLPYHSPEIEYLRHGENALRLPATTNPEGYAASVAELMSDGVLHERLRAGCRAAARVYTLQAMVGRFAGGVLDALRYGKAFRRSAETRRSTTGSEAGPA